MVTNPLTMVDIKEEHAWTQEEEEHVVNVKQEFPTTNDDVDADPLSGSISSNDRVDAALCVKQEIKGESRQTDPIFGFVDVATSHSQPPTQSQVSDVDPLLLLNNPTSPYKTLLQPRRPESLQPSDSPDSSEAIAAQSQEQTALMKKKIMPDEEVSSDSKWSDFRDCSSSSSENDLLSDVESIGSVERELYKSLNKGSKRKVRWKREKLKQRKNAGKAYTSSSQTQACYEKIHEDSQKLLHDGFWKIGVKTRQDTLLLSNVHQQEIKNRQVTVKTKRRECAWKYTVDCDKRSISVCQKFLLQVLEITHKRLRTVQNKIKEGNLVMTEKRGTHNNRPTKIADDVWELAEEHLNSIPHTSSHCSMKKSDRKYFNDPNLTTKRLFTLFQQYYFDKQSLVLRMKYSTYNRFFRERSNFSFHRSCSDV